MSVNKVIRLMRYVLFYVLTPLLLLVFMSLSVVCADSYQQDVQDALNQLQASKELLTQFDASSIPNFKANPKERAYLPTEQGQLEQKGQQFVHDNQEAQDLSQIAQQYQETTLDKEHKDKARQDLEHTLNDNDALACQDGACITTQAEDSTDFDQGIVQMGALNGTAQEARDNQVPEGLASMFKASNITCRVVYKLNRFNFCNPNNERWGVSQSEKELHQAQREHRAVLVSSDTYCSEIGKILGHKTCLQKRQSWCVFQSRLALMIQVEARRQLGIDFGFVGGEKNQADCRGLTPKEVASIEFDAPQMQQALNELTQEFASKKQLPEPNQVANAVEGQLRQRQGAGYE